MDITAATPDIRLSPQPPAQTAAKIKEAADQFEAIFIRQFLRETMQSNLGGPLTDSEGKHAIYQSMIHDILAEELSTKGAFGISSILQSQFISTSKHDG